MFSSLFFVAVWLIHTCPDPGILLLAADGEG